PAANRESLPVQLPDFDRAGLLMRRLAARLIFVFVGATLAAALGTLTALIASRPGKDLLARLLSEQSRRLVRGSLPVGRISGDFLSHLELDSVVVRDTSGALLADVPRLEVGFRIAWLVANRFVFTSVVARSPRIEVTKHRSGRINYQEIFRLGEGDGG